MALQSGDNVRTNLRTAGQVAAHHDVAVSTAMRAAVGAAAGLIAAAAAVAAAAHGHHAQPAALVAVEPAAFVQHISTIERSGTKVLPTCAAGYSRRRRFRLLTKDLAAQEVWRARSCLKCCCFSFSMQERTFGNPGPHPEFDCRVSASGRRGVSRGVPLSEGAYKSPESRPPSCDANVGPSGGSACTVVLYSFRTPPHLKKHIQFQE